MINERFLVYGESYRSNLLRLFYLFISNRGIFINKEMLVFNPDLTPRRETERHLLTLNCVDIIDKEVNTADTAR